MSEGMEVRTRSPDGMACDACAELGTCDVVLRAFAVRSTLG